MGLTAVSCDRVNTERPPIPEGDQLYCLYGIPYKDRYDGLPGRLPLVYLPGSGQPIQLARIGRTGIKTIGKHVDELVLEDGYSHMIALARARDGAMTVTVDEAEVIKIKSTALSNPFGGVAIVNSGGDFAVRNIAVHGAR